MAAPLSHPPPPGGPAAPAPQPLNIYLLPNLMTAGNLFCGFLALTKIVEADRATNFGTNINTALFLILLACIFDLLDGRLARMGGKESPFGREFDSLADVVSFGVAPAFLVYRVVLKDVFANELEIAWFIASIYLVCGALRLARFNCLAAQPGYAGSSEFMGFPIPAAAGLVASLTLFIMWLDGRELTQGNWRYILPVILVFLSFMMVSEVKYPSFKKIDWRTKRPFVKVVVAILVIGFFLILWKKVVPVAAPVVFTTYLLYGFIRPRISRKVRDEIEQEDESDDHTEGPA
ncbi:CDP-diacylglycerol--serine O-phosphatidyltransferase [Verrucomicrobiota bacterium]|nr:CDP-diacylglycerol--serine O-phosphatidyltransferase [Verrucomicrobiota bacterium]